MDATTQTAHRRKRAIEIALIGVPPGVYRRGRNAGRRQADLAAERPCGPNSFGGGSPRNMPEQLRINTNGPVCFREIRAFRGRKMLALCTKLELVPS
jgi:hypothetical protein